ncbi:Zinc finger CCCH domain-containing protein 7 [Platanthera zijinensis]|uniref:Zinc finger CCCH domain-containing protein 7 n=1 Tax=Platanthera zijinensis TaxID=2320716 RepID=A0AAP0AV10_9ASPA
MDPHSSPRLSRRRRYDSFSLLQHFPDPNNARYRHPTFAPLAHHPSVSPLPPFPPNYYQEPHRRFVYPGDDFYYLSPQHLNPTGFDRPILPFPRVSDRTIYHSLPHGKFVLPDIWKKSSGGGVTLEKPGVFEERPGMSQPYENSLKLADPDPGPMDMRRLQSEQDRFLGEVSDWRYSRQLRFLDARENSCHDPWFEQLSQEAASLATEPPPFYSPRGLGLSGSANNRCGNYSSVFVHCPPRSPLSSGRYFSDLDVVSSTEAMLANSQAIGNGLEPQRGPSLCRKRNCVDVPPDCGFEVSQCVEYKPIKKSDPSNVANEIGFSSSYHMVRKTHNIPIMACKRKLEEDCSIGNKGKRKMSNDRNGKFHARSCKRPMQKPSAFSRIQSGLSVWDRLEEKPLILCPTSPSCTLSSPPRISIETEAKVDILDLPIKSSVVLARAVDPLNLEPISVKEDLSVEKPVEIPNIVMKKKKKKMSKVRREMNTPIVSIFAGSSARQEVGKIFNVISSGSVSVQAEANKVEVSKDATKILCNKKVKKLAAGNFHDTKKAAKIFCQVEGCKFGCGEKYVKETNDCIPNDDANGKLVNGSHLQHCQKGQLMRMTPNRDASGNIISLTANQAGDHGTETLDDSGGEPSELEKTFDNRFISILVSDALVHVNTSSQPFNKLPLNNAATQDSSLTMDENDANSSKQVKLEVMGSVNSIPLKIEQDMPTADSATPPDMLGSGEVFVSTGSKTLSYIDNSVNCNNNDIEIEKQVKMLRKMKIFTASREPEVTGKYFSSQSRFHVLQDLSFSEISSEAANQKLPSEGTVKENNEFNLPSFNLIPQSDYGMNSGENLGNLRIDTNGTKLEQAFLLESMKMDSSDLIFGDTLLSRQCSESMEFINNMSSGHEEKKHRGKSETFVRTKVSLASESIHESGKIIKNQKIISQNSQALPSDVVYMEVPPNAKTCEEFSCKQTSPQYAVSKFLSHTTKNSGQLKDVARTCQAGRHRTWVRTNTHLHSDENQKCGRISSNQAPKKLVKIHNSSYIRKGNSLIRKVPAKLPPVLLPTVDAASRKFESIPERSSLRESRGEFPDIAKLSDPVFERPKTPPLPSLSKLSDCTMHPYKDFPLLRQVVSCHDRVTNEGKQHDGQSKGLAFGNLWSQDTASFNGVEILNPTCVTSAKQKKNQLDAAPGSETYVSSNFLIESFQIPVHHPTGTSKTLPFSSSYLYYRSKRNQLIRSAYSSGSQLTEIPACEANLIGLIQRSSALPLKRLDVHQKAKKPRISSLVWTLTGNKLSKRSIGTLGCQMVFPYLFPWKRVVNQKSFIMNDRFPISSRFPLSFISQKLQCLRKRDTIYKVSTDGFTLRKAGVVSIGGSNLKWSKSIEKRSKKASEATTLAVAEVERNKRERKKIKSTHGNGKNKHGLTRRSLRGTGKQGDARERIFRVGSARYKMDASKRTLIRIADDHSSPTSQQPGTNSLKSFIPRRLIIGNDEYVRIGNGNQLVRDPKKLQRILASEKVRWSLHTARLKLAQKRQYCLFFTRFGKCNRIGGKCPYIHDSSKVSICTKFLRGQCSDVNCKLTHKVIQERMPDCSYFLKGLCTNINCPYRHVKVNANAPLCDGFLRGHCADGDECRKKHSYACPIFEATGSCPQGSLCKLGHPKIQSKSRKRKRTKLKSSSQGRYFFSSIGKASKPLSIASSQNDLEDPNDIFYSDGRFSDYINLDTDSDDAGIGNNVLMDSYPGMLSCGYHDMKSCDIDALIKPVQIMKRDELAIF